MKNIKKIYLLMIPLLVVLSLALCASFSFLSHKIEEHGKLNIVAGTLNYKIESNDLKNNKIIVKANEIKEINIGLTSLNEIDSKYELYYSLDKNDDNGVFVGYSYEFDAPTGVINAFDNKKVKVLINNTTEQEISVEFAVVGGLTNNELVLSNGNSLIYDSTIPTVAINSNLPNSVTKGDSYTILGSYTANGSSGGSVSCSSDLDGSVTDTNQLTTLGMHTITCTAKTGSGKTTTATKTVKITYTAYNATNLITNGSFENGINGWDNSNLSTLTVSNGIATLTSPTTGWQGFFGTTYPIAGTDEISHIFYIKTRAKVVSDSYGFGFGTASSGGMVFTAPVVNYVPGEYTVSSANIQPSKIISTAPGIYLAFYHTKTTAVEETVYIDYLFAVDLTKTFGAGNEPDKAWCDKHINYFDGTTIIYK